MSAEQLTFYDVLNVDKSSTQEEIKAAFRRAVKVYHPDSLPAGCASWVIEEAKERLKAANEAWAILQDEDKRKHYDDLIAALGDASTQA